MKNQEIIDHLTNLVQLDIDAILAYDHAIADIDEMRIRNNLERFRGDHERHVENLSRLIVTYGGRPPEFSRDFKGFIIEGMTAIMTKGGTRSTLLAMTSNEAITNARYRAATSLDFPPEIKETIQHNYRDEQHHIAFIKEVLKEKFGFGSRDQQGTQRFPSSNEDMGLPA